MSQPLVDRRGPNRPSNGDKTTCPRCGVRGAEFSERYRFALDGWRARTTPAWVCDCGDVRTARRDQAPGAGELPTAAERLRATSKRVMLQMRSAHAHVKRVLTKDAGRKKSN
jgi:hypothetical protein